MEERPWLSLCIPTYNRAEVLDRTLRALFDDPDFDPRKIEVVVCDNCSEDRTPEVAARYPQVRYFRNAENIRDANFSQALQHGRGEYLKLMNDTVRFVPGGLKLMLDTVGRHLATRGPLFLYEWNRSRQPETVVCPDVGSFICEASVRATWIANFGCWRRDAGVTDDRSGAALQLLQVVWSIRIAEAGPPPRQNLFRTLLHGRGGDRSCEGGLQRLPGLRGQLSDDRGGVSPPGCRVAGAVPQSQVALVPPLRGAACGVAAFPLEAHHPLRQSRSMADRAGTLWPSTLFLPDNLLQKSSLPAARMPLMRLVRKTGSVHLRKRRKKDLSPNGRTIRPSAAAPQLGIGRYDGFAACSSVCGRMAHAAGCSLHRERSVIGIVPSGRNGPCDRRRTSATGTRPSNNS